MTSEAAYAKLAVASAPTDRGLRALFEREYEAMIRLAFVITRDQLAAEEVVQEAFLEVHRRWARLETPGGYLRRCVVNGSRRRVRRRVRRREVESSVPAQLAVTAGEYLTDALTRLPERQRTAVVLAYYGRYSAREIGEVLDCRESTARSLVHRGIERLRKEIR